MSSSGLMYGESGGTGVLRQGEIVSNIMWGEVMPEMGEDGKDALSTRRAHYAVVVSQDCDLVWDWESRYCGGSEAKKLLGVLFCEAGLSGPVLKENNSSLWRNFVKGSRVERYHFLQECGPDFDLKGEGFPELVVDFKRFFSVSPGEIYARLDLGQVERRSQINDPYMRQLVYRLWCFQGRVAIP